MLKQVQHDGLWLWAALFVATFFFATPATAQTFPELTGRVVDNADYLSPAEEADLTQRLEALEDRTGRQFVIVTVPNLRGGGSISYPIEDFTYRLGREWGIGSAERDDGVILLVADEEREVRIEVGYGLEPVLTDAYSARIIRNDIVPQFRSGNMAGGIVAGADAIITQLELPPEEAEARQREALDTGGYESSGALPFWVSIFFLLPPIVWLILIFWIVPMIFRRIFGLGRKSGRKSSWGPVIVWGGGSGGSWGGSSGGFSGGFSGGGFSGGGGSFGGGGASGGW